MRRRPYAVILFDGVEKVYPDVFSAMLQILNDGRVTDGQGRTVDFTDTVLILTSHIGSASILDLAGDPARHAEMGKRVNEALRPTSARRFSTAWMRQSSSTASRPRSRARSWSCRSSTWPGGWRRKNWGYDPAFGARPLKRAIQRDLETPIAKAILGGTFPAGSTIAVDVQNERLRFQQALEAPLPVLV